MEYVIFDLDGTLADITHRLHLVNTPKPDWPKFFAEAKDDKCNEWIRKLVWAMKVSQYTILIMSARPEDSREITEDWLFRHYITYDQLHFVRANGNHAPDDKLKREWLHKNFPGKMYEDILFVVDDRTRVVEMWRSEGLNVLHCNRWEEYEKPKKAIDQKRTEVQKTKGPSIPGKKPIC